VSQLASSETVETVATGAAGAAGAAGRDVSSPPALLRLVSVPAAHPYVRSVTASPNLVVLDDPRPPGAPEGQWWPPVALDPRWIRAGASDADLLHIHFGTESFTPERLGATLDAARAVGWPVVFTVHDLVHPQLREQDVYRRQLDVLVPRADALLTLTPGAAEEIERRWGRRALVVPHPSLLTSPPPRRPVLAWPARPRALRIGMHLKDLRSNVAAESMLAALVAALDRLADDGIDASAEVRMHRTVRDPEARDRVRERGASSNRVTLVEHDRLDDSELAASLATLDACVLPYGYGTHSGWLELCWDLGVPLAVPDTGYYAQQHVDDSVAAFAPDPAGVSLASALRTVLESPGATRAGSAERDREVGRRRVRRAESDLAVATAHSELYRRLIAERRA
jgi:hypothetical protein